MMRRKKTRRIMQTTEETDTWGRKGRKNVARGERRGVRRRKNRGAQMRNARDKNGEWRTAPEKKEQEKIHGKNTNV